MEHSTLKGSTLNTGSGWMPPGLKDVDLAQLKAMTQKQRVLAYLERNGQLDPLEAWKHLGVYRLGAVIFELRKEHRIETLDANVTNRFGEPCEVALYVYQGPKP